MKLGNCIKREMLSYGFTCMCFKLACDSAGASVLCMVSLISIDRVELYVSTILMTENYIPISHQVKQHNHTDLNMAYIMALQPWLFMNFELVFFSAA